MPVVAIPSQARRNRWTLTLVSFLLLIITLSLLSVWSSAWLLFGYFLVTLSCVALLLGLSKIREPEHSLLLREQGLQYCHRYGIWRVDWQNIQRIDQPRVRTGLTHENLSFIGVKLKQPEQVLSQISVRLASRLLMQQRPLLLLESEADCASGQCYAEHILEDDEFQCSDGKRLRGIQSMFAHRMKRLRSKLGYDLYIDTHDLSWPAEKVIQQLRLFVDKAREQG